MLTCPMDLVWDPGPTASLQPGQRFGCHREQEEQANLTRWPLRRSNLCPGCSKEVGTWSVAERPTSLSCFSMEGGSHMPSASLKGLQLQSSLSLINDALFSLSQAPFYPSP